MPKTIIVKAFVDGEEQKVTINFDEEQGYVTLILNDYNQTQIKFDWETIEKIGRKAMQA